MVYIGLSSDFVQARRRIVRKIPCHQFINEVQILTARAGGNGMHRQGEILGKRYVTATDDVDGHGGTVILRQ